MARIPPAAPAQYAAVADYVSRWTATKGYPPNTWHTMLRKPGIFRAYRDLHGAVMMEEGEVPRALKFMMAAVVSMAAGDHYCAAHNAENAAHLGQVPLDKVEALMNFRSDGRFTPAERTALELAEAAGSHPPRVRDEHFTALSAYWSADAMVEMVGVLSLLGWLNRWAQTVKPPLEPAAQEFGKAHLAGWDWQPD